MNTYGSQLQNTLTLKDSMKDMNSVAAYDDILKVEQGKLEALESLISDSFAMVEAQVSKVVNQIKTPKIQNDESTKSLLKNLKRSAWLIDRISRFSLLVCMQNSCDSQLVPISQTLLQCARSLS